MNKFHITKRKKQMENEIISDMSNADYHAHNSISNSTLGLCKESISNYKWAKECPKVEGDNRALIIGSAAHALILEGREVYEAEYAVAPKFNRATKQGKADFAEFHEANKDKEVLSADEGALIENMYLSVMAHPTAKKLLTGGKPEQSFFWTDPETGERCKIRPDYLKADTIIDLKTAKDFVNLNQKIYDYGYHRQCAMYKEGFEQVTGRPPAGFIFIFVSKAVNLGRHTVKVVELKPDFEALGFEEYRSLLDSLSTAKALDSFDVIEEVGLPKWL